MIACVLASGSRGNSTLVASLSTKVLLDLGTSSLYVEKKLKDINIEPKEINGIILSHTHVDHINGIKVFIKKYHTKLFLSQSMYDELTEIFPIENYEIIDGDFIVNDIDIDVIKTSHDTPDSNGYILNSNGKSVVYVTDTGYINNKNYKKLTNKNIYVFESNHDVKMLMEGHYPYHIKQRILGDRGHLSNKDSAYYLSKFIGPNTEIVVLSHLSHDNNDPSLAVNTLREKLEEENNNFDNIIVATQNERTEVLEV